MNRSDRKIAYQEDPNSAKNIVKFMMRANRHARGRRIAFCTKIWLHMQSFFGPSESSIVDTCFIDELVAELENCM